MRPAGQRLHAVSHAPMLGRNFKDFRARIKECARAAGEAKIETLAENDLDARWRRSWLI
jgi:hypothetical protein